MRNDRANLARRSADAMPRGSISCWEDFARNNKGRRIGTKIGKEVCEADKSEETSRWNSVEPKPKDTKDDGENQKASNLDRLPTKSINESN